MPTFTISESELEIVRHALAMLNDIEEDTGLENVSGNLFPSAENPTVLTPASAKILRDELDAVMNRRMRRHATMRTFGVAYNPDSGYSV